MIYCFSGTGNSRLVAARLADALGESGVVAVDSDVKRSPAADDCRVVWVFPVHAWSVPAVVAQYIMALPDDTFNPAAVHYMVATCGDDVGETDLVWRALMRAKGWRSGGAYSVEMPNTYVLLPGFDVDAPEVERQKLKKAEPRIKAVAKKILMSGESVQRDVVAGSFPRFKTRVLGPLFRRFLMSPRPFKADEVKCNGCGSCARHCPLHNITMCDNTPSWGNHCAICLACYHGCRQNAVSYGRATRRKGHYRGPNSVE